MQKVADILMFEVFLIYGRPDKLVFDTQISTQEVNAILESLKITSGVSWPFSHLSLIHI